MKALLIPFLLLGAAAQDSSPGGLAIERTLKSTTLDRLGRKSEIQRKELILVKGPRLAVIDLTFGSRLLIRTDQRRIWAVDPLAREYAEYSFDEAAAIRVAALEELKAAKARVPGTTDEKELEAVLEGLDQFAAAPKAELKAEGALREVIVNGDRVRLSVQVNEQFKNSGWLEALAAAGAFPAAVAEKIPALGGLPVKGTIRYALFLERRIEQFEVTSVQARDVPDAEFELPPGLQRTPLRGFERVPDRIPKRPPPLKRDFAEDDKK
jgi:hypothetical protein